jgi:hypothetical protein
MLLVMVASLVGLRYGSVLVGGSMMAVQVIAGHCNFALCAKQDVVLWQEGDETVVHAFNSTL